MKLYSDTKYLRRFAGRKKGRYLLWRTLDGRSERVSMEEAIPFLQADGKKASKVFDIAGNDLSFLSNVLDETGDMVVMKNIARTASILPVKGDGFRAYPVRPGLCAVFHDGIVPSPEDVALAFEKLPTYGKRSGEKEVEEVKKTYHVMQGKNHRHALLFGPGFCLDLGEAMPDHGCFKWLTVAETLCLLSRKTYPDAGMWDFSLRQCVRDDLPFDIMAEGLAEEIGMSGTPADFCPDDEYPKVLREAVKKIGRGSAVDVWKAFADLESGINLDDPIPPSLAVHLLPFFSGSGLSEKLACPCGPVVTAENGKGNTLVATPWFSVVIGKRELSDKARESLEVFCDASGVKADSLANDFEENGEDGPVLTRVFESEMLRMWACDTIKDGLSAGTGFRDVPVVQPKCELAHRIQAMMGPERTAAGFDSVLFEMLMAQSFPRRDESPF